MPKCFSLFPPFSTFENKSRSSSKVSLRSSTSESLPSMVGCGVHPFVLPSWSSVGNNSRRSPSKLFLPSSPNNAALSGPSDTSPPELKELTCTPSSATRAESSVGASPVLSASPALVSLLALSATMFWHILEKRLPSPPFRRSFTPPLSRACLPSTLLGPGKPMPMPTAAISETAGAVAGVGAVAIAGAAIDAEGATAAASAPDPQGELFPAAEEVDDDSLETPPPPPPPPCSAFEPMSIVRLHRTFLSSSDSSRPRPLPSPLTSPSPPLLDAAASSSPPASGEGDADGEGSNFGSSRGMLGDDDSRTTPRRRRKRGKLFPPALPLSEGGGGSGRRSDVAAAWSSVAAPSSSPASRIFILSLARRSQSETENSSSPSSSPSS
mmetsp:Transcript_20118/g.58173  ORF Transcript_20118/g.58173 Transcript_20118/m.58173 type:complete len:382 (-) Transcript_20118:15-1160(-)